MAALLLCCGAPEEICGDRKIVGAEVCDDGNTSDGDGCSADCRSNETCGNGVLDEVEGETCDDGNIVTESECAYGTVSCEACGGGCQSFAATGRFCGDGKVDPEEQCDDGNTVTEECGLGQDSCDVCDGACQQQTLTGLICGDGQRDSNEACDDGNTDACGSCSADCGQEQAPTQATGTITVVAGALLRDGETFVLNDGVNPAVTFEYDDDGDVQGAGNVGIAYTVADVPAVVAASTAAAILGERTTGSLSINAGSANEVVALLNDRAGAFGNQAISEAVIEAAFTVSGMSGGRGADCAAGVGCTTSTDCAPPQTCLATTGTCG